MRYYAVKAGREPGIYTTWADCLAQTYKHPGALFKAFDDLQEAETYLQEAEPGAAPINDALPYAYIDGSYSPSRNIYAYGGYISAEGRYYIIQGTGSNPDFLPERNIAGEVLGALQVMYKAAALNIREMNLFYDYAGIEQWAQGAWRAKTKLAQHYSTHAGVMADCVTVHFQKVEGHTGIEGNELADALAKEAAGVKIRKKDAAAIAELREKADRPLSLSAEGGRNEKY